MEFPVVARGIVAVLALVASSCSAKPDPASECTLQGWIRKCESNLRQCEAKSGSAAADAANCRVESQHAVAGLNSQLAAVKAGVVGASGSQAWIALQAMETGDFIPLKTAREKAEDECSAAVEELRLLRRSPDCVSWGIRSRAKSVDSLAKLNQLVAAIDDYVARFPRSSEAPAFARIRSKLEARREALERHAEEAASDTMRKVIDSLQ